jgi:hypothetical protein
MISRRRFLEFGLSTAPLLLGWSRDLRAGPLPGCFAQYDKPRRLDIDVHCHVFNGSDLRVKRFLSMAAYRELPKPLWPVVKALAPVLQWATWEFAPKTGEEMEHLEKFGSPGRVRERSTDTLESLVSTDAADGTRRYTEGMSKYLKTPEGRKFYEEYRRYVQGEQRAGLLEASAAQQLTAPELEQLATPELLKQRLLQEEALGVTPVFGFAHNFFQYRYINAYNLLRNFGCDHGHIQVIAPAMVDYDYGLGAQNDPPLPSPITEQLQVMERIAVLFDGRVLPYAPFDPWRVAAGDSSIIRAAQTAIESGALLGLKVYPPMGFAPFGNSGLMPAPNEWPRDTGFSQRMDDALAAVWGWASAANHMVPVLSHCGPSNYPYPDFQNMGKPMNWSVALAKFSNLRVCFGHSGGQDQLDLPQGWPDEFAKLESQYVGAYSDLSYFSWILTNKDRNKIQSGLEKVLTNHPSAAKRLMYGSDWTMLALESNAKHYEEDMELTLKDPPLAKTTDDVLSANAIDFLGLHKGDPTRTRLEGFYSKKGVTAHWLQGVT